MAKLRLWYPENIQCGRVNFRKDSLGINDRLGKDSLQN